ncbi:hypothetical protein HPP92_026911 [Vanilla planifolia]|uniref:Uncharacterized protein n=1 Tax=Vanilla planifolia TaxID=51239 RepID=A0A835PFE0_VANPL|nr:hypothetical protein HPP92_026911 [Vanilla planifolia]
MRSGEGHQHHRVDNDEAEAGIIRYKLYHAMRWRNNSIHSSQHLIQEEAVKVCMSNLHKHLAYALHVVVTTYFEDLSFKAELYAEAHPEIFRDKKEDLEDGGQATIDELPKMNLGTTQDPLPTYVSTLLSNKRVEKVLLLKFRDFFA